MAEPSTGSCIDLEPSGAGAAEDLVIDTNTLQHETDAVAVSLSGTGNGPPARRIRFSGNTLTGGGMGGVNARDVAITGNVVTAASTGQVLAFRGVNGLSIQGNRISARSRLESHRHQPLQTRQRRVQPREALIQLSDALS
jgi:hypothetical protein